MARRTSVTVAEFRKIMGFPPKNGRGARYARSPKEERTVDGILFASKLEAKVYRRLRAWVDEWPRGQGNSIRAVLRQVPLHLPGNVRYVADFMILEFQKVGSPHRLGVDVRLAFFAVIDAKGHPTDMYKLKKKQVREIYGIEIQEVTK